MQDLVSSFIENLQGFLAQARDAENVNNDKMMEIAQVTLDKVAKSEIDDEISEDLRMVSSGDDQYMEWHGYNSPPPPTFLLESFSLMS